MKKWMLWLAVGVLATLVLVLAFLWHKGRQEAGPVLDLASQTPAEAVLAEGMPLRSTASRSQAQTIRRLLAAGGEASGLSPVTIDHPLDEAVYPPGFPPPTFVWHDGSPKANCWVIDISPGDGSGHMYVMTRGNLAPPTPPRPEELPESARSYRPAAYQMSAQRWKPGPEVWAMLRDRSVNAAATVSFLGFDFEGADRPVSRGSVKLRASNDPVGALIFYRDLPLPFSHASANVDQIRWRMGNVTVADPPPTLLKEMKVCANCHCFTPDGKTLAMDVDYGNDKGSYIITETAPETILTRDKVITWSDYRREDSQPTFGLLSQISPNGRYVISTVKDRSVFLPVPDLYYSQRFFPVKGILVVYDRRAKTFSPLPGADDRRFVQSNPMWSPDGRTILFARTAAHELHNLKDQNAVIIKIEEAKEFFEGGRKYRYDLYRMPFNGGKGGTPELLPGASANGRSNYFPKFSPDGKWIVFCQADSFMLLQPDSELYIMPAEGGQPRKMRCNMPGKMNSWHSWSPNGRWLVFSSKANGPYTQLWLTHVDAAGNDSPPVLLDWFTSPYRAANIPEFVNVRVEQFGTIVDRFADYRTHFSGGMNYARYGEYAKALEEFREVLKEKADHIQATYWAGVCLARTGRENEAVPYLRRSLELSPDLIEAHGWLGSLLSRQGDYKEALSHLEITLKAKPDDQGTALHLAWMLATCPDPAYRDGVRAVVIAERIVNSTQGGNPDTLDCLAAAYAEAGRFDQAVQTAQRALLLRPENTRAGFQEPLKLYQAGKPFRQR